MSKNLDLSLVRAFVAVVDYGSLTAAANRLHVTQGAVSQQLKRLEDSVGLQLLKRGRRGIVLTHTGEWLLGKARRMLEINDEILVVSNAQPVCGPLHFGAPHDLVGVTLVPVFKLFTETWPSVDLSIRCGSSPELADAFKDGSLDLAVIETPEHESKGECLRVERLVWAGARGGTAHLKRPLPISLVSESCAFRPAVLQTLRTSDLQWRTVFESGSIEATDATVGSGLTVTARLLSTVPPELDILGPDSALPDLPNFAICLHARPDGGSPAARALAQCIRHEMRGRAQRSY